MEKPSKTISELNEDCEILIQKDIDKRLINYIPQRTDFSAHIPQRTDFSAQLKLNPPETHELYFCPKNRCRTPRMLAAPPSTTDKMAQKRSFDPNRRLIDATIQATEERASAIPRSTMLSRVRQHLSKRNSGAQSEGIKYKTIKTQTESCARHSKGVSVEPLEFIGACEKATNVPIVGKPGMVRNQATQMYEHITQSELYCIEWIHKNLFEVKLNPNTLVVGDRIKDVSESPCFT